MAFLNHGFARTLETTRFNLILFDISNPTHLELNLRLLYDPAFQANFGDYGIKTQDDVLRLWVSTLIRPTTCPRLLTSLGCWLHHVSET
jgi:hypothetical protein